MKKHILLATASAALLSMALSAMAQNVAIVNGRAVPMSRMDALAQQVAKSGRPVTPDMQGQLKQEIIAREIFAQAAQAQGLDATDDFKTQMELMRQSLIIRELFASFQAKNPVTDAEVKAEYDKFAA
ncbi:MAG: peptidylprolyl isomerase, partial [Rhodoferax sp.]|nr:peptidylprolyl isomerase [Rhodoferax sp.]